MTDLSNKEIMNRVFRARRDAAKQEREAELGRKMVREERQELNRQVWRALQAERRSARKAEKIRLIEE